MTRRKNTSLGATGAGHKSLCYAGAYKKTPDEREDGLGPRGKGPGRRRTIFPAALVAVTTAFRTMAKLKEKSMTALENELD
jgi:hypothetical protein